MSGNSKAIDAGQLAARQWERQGCDQSRRDNDCHRVDVGRVLEDRAEIPRAADEIGTCCLAGACALAEDDIDVLRFGGKRVSTADAADMHPQSRSPSTPFEPCLCELDLGFRETEFCGRRQRGQNIPENIVRRELRLSSRQ
jgi:hypothetical protein